MAGVVVLVDSGDDFSVIKFPNADGHWTESGELNVTKADVAVGTFAAGHWSSVYKEEEVKGTIRRARL